MNRKLKNPYIRRKLSLGYEEGVPTSVGSSDRKNNALSNVQDVEKHYQLRDRKENTFYCEKSDNEIRDFSSDHSEYVPSPERHKTNTPSSSSLGGDSNYIENVLNDVTRTPSTISNLSQEIRVIDNAIFIASPTVIYKPDALNKQTNNNQRQSHHWSQSQIVDISLKDPTPNFNKIANIETDPNFDTEPNTVEAERTLTNEENLDSDITLTNVTENSNKETVEHLEIRIMNDKHYFIQSKNIINVTIEPLSPEDWEDINEIQAIETETYAQKRLAENNDPLDLSTKSTVFNLEKECETEERTSINIKAVRFEAGDNRIDKDLKNTENDKENECDKQCEIEERANVIEVVRSEVDDNRIDKDVENTENNKESECDKQREIEETASVIELVRSESGSPDSLSILLSHRIDKDVENTENDKERESEESTVYSPEKESGEQCETEERPSIDIEVVRIETGDSRIDENFENANNAEENENTDPKKLTRKRKRDEGEWRDVKNKKLKNSGEAYESRSKIDRSKKTIKPVCACKKGCGDKFTEAQRVSIFKNFYNLGSRELQWQFISRHVKTEPVKKITVMRKSTRTQTLKYYLSSEECKEIQVCKVFFLNTLNITEQMVFTTLEKLEKDESLIDNRGKHDNRPKKVKPDTEESVITHIKSFPTVESHYTRKDSKREYLSEHLNISKMYRLYKTWFSGQSRYENITNMATKRQYERIFNTSFNYSFHKPKKDQCALCAKYKQADSADKANLEHEYTAHLTKKDKVRELKNKEKEIAGIENDNSTSLAIFDLQKVIGIPQSEVSIFHYKRKYPVYNFTVFDAIRKKGYCYVWHGQIAKKGCKEIGSCLLQYMTSQAENGIKKILFYSDGCGGQNKNRYIFALYAFAAKKLNLDITHKFFVTGHSQNEGDSMHACIERNLKNKVIYTPDQIYSIIMNAKVTGHKYDLKEMDQTEIFDIKPLVVDKKWKKDIKGEIIRWSEVMEISVSKETPNRLFFKYDFDDGLYSELDISEPTTVPCRVRGRGGNRSRGLGRGRDSRSSSLLQSETLPNLKQAYNRLLPISKELYNDLQSLCHSGAIPRHYHGFYNALRFESTTKNDKTDESD